MPKIAVFVPTCRPGGIDVFEASIERQTIEPDVIYVADELEREEGWTSIAEYLTISIKMLHPQKKLGDIRNLAGAYNEAARVAAEDDIDLFISLQDYIWAPPDGIEKFVKLHEKDPNALITGLTSISEDPLESWIEDINGEYTIFKKPFYKKPERIAWHDVRGTDIYNYGDGDIYRVYPEHWESNWAAVPVDMFRRGIRWDKEYDKGIAYENQDFAKQCNLETGCNVLLDLTNVAISLPHKKYWPQEESDIKKYSNRWLFESKWG